MKLTSWSLHCVKSLFDTSAKLLGSFWANIHLHLCAAAVPVPAGFTSKAGESVKAWHLLESACPKVAKQANYVLTLHSRKDLNWPFVAAVPIRWDPSHKLDVSMCFCDYVVAVPWKKKISLLRMLPPQNEMWWRTFVNVLKPAMIKGNMACSHTATVTEHTQRCESGWRHRTGSATGKRDVWLTVLGTVEKCESEVDGRWFSRQKGRTG